MALIKCTGCGHDVSDKATECPHCGCPISQENHLTLQIAGYNAKTAETLINKRISVVLCWLIAPVGRNSVSCIGQNQSLTSLLT